MKTFAISQPPMTRPLHGRRAKRAQWLHDASLLYRMHLLFFYGLADSGPEHAARILRRESADRRERRLARRK